MNERQENLDFIIRYLMAERGENLSIPSSLVERQRLMRALMNVREPKAASEAFLQAQDKELQMQRKDKGVVEIPIAPTRQLLLWQGDITRLQVDAIVNAANGQMLGCFVPLHACIDNAIHSAAGIQLREECNELMQGRELPTGQAMLTKGYNLPAKHVIHTVGPIIPDGIPTKAQEEQLAQCYRNCLEIAEEHALQSVVFCCISTGVFRFPNQRAAEIAVKTVKAFKTNSIKTVVFNVFKDEDYAIYQQLI